MNLAKPNGASFSTKQNEGVGILESRVERDKLHDSGSIRADASVGNSAQHLLGGSPVIQRQFGERIIRSEEQEGARLKGNLSQRTKNPKPNSRAPSSLHQLNGRGK